MCNNQADMLVISDHTAIREAKSQCCTMLQFQNTCQNLSRIGMQALVVSSEQAASKPPGKQYQLVRTSYTTTGSVVSTIMHCTFSLASTTTITCHTHILTEWVQT